MQAEKPDVFVLATNRTESVRDFATMSFKAIGIQIKWEGSGLNEKGVDKATNKILVKVNPDFDRPAEVDLLIGNAEKAKRILGWEAQTSLEELCELMIKEDIKRNKKGVSF